MAAPIFSVRVQVPATTANLGPGFDVLGLALALYNEVRLTARRSGPKLTIVNEGEGSGRLPTDERHLVFQAVAKVFERVGKSLPASLELGLVNRIPLARGLGSSSAAIVGGIVAANSALRRPLSQDDMLQLAVRMEGHPDNVAPALAGGLVVSAVSEGKVVSVPWKDKKIFRGLKAAVAVPDFELPTAKARSVLAKGVSREDAVFNVSRVALLLSALSQGRLDLLATAMEDRLHQSARAALVPGLAEVVAAAKEAGAMGSALSGAGPSILALTPAAKAPAVGRAMQQAFAGKQVTSRVLILDADFQGAEVKE